MQRSKFEADMLSVVIPTLNAERTLAATLSALMPAAISGVVRQVVIVDGGSDDATLAIAEEMGADVVTSATGRGQQLATGARAARCPWLLFLHADTVLGDGWDGEVLAFVEAIEAGKRPNAAAAFRFAVDDRGILPAVLGHCVRLRCWLFRLPYGDQGLMISRQLYDAVGGYADMPLMEDVELLKRLGWRRIAMLRTTAVTSADKFKAEGYMRRSFRNVACLMIYRVGAPLHVVQRIYSGNSINAKSIKTSQKN